MFQDPNLFPWLSVRRNIQAGLVARGVLRRHRREVDEFLRLVGLEAFADHYPHQLSGGMAQRAALARALINHPKVLLLDEPLGALDQFTRMRMQDEVLRLWQARGTTMVLVTHDIDEAIYMSDRIVIMTPRPGRIERTIEVVLERPRQRNSPRFLELRAEILEMLHFAGGATDEVADAGTIHSAVAPRAASWEPGHEQSIEGALRRSCSRRRCSIAAPPSRGVSTAGGATVRPDHAAAELPRPGSETYREMVSAFYSGVAALDVDADERAKTSLTRATELVPGEPAAWANLGLLDLRLGDHEAAAKDLEKARKLSPENGAIEHLLGLLESRRGQFGESDRALSACGRAGSG